MNSLTLWEVDFDVKNVRSSKTRWESFDFLMPDGYGGSVPEREGSRVGLGHTRVYVIAPISCPEYIRWWEPTRLPERYGLEPTSRFNSASIHSGEQNPVVQRARNPA
jgi:hypothetical protein